MCTASTFTLALHIHPVHWFSIGFRRFMTAGDLLLMVAVTMIYQHSSTGCFTETKKLMPHHIK